MERSGLFHKCGISGRRRAPYHWGVSYSSELTESRIARLAEQGLDLVSFWQECTPLIAKVVPHLPTPCWFTVDPASLLATSHYQTELPELPDEWLAYEYLHEEEYQSLSIVARSERGASTIHEATGGDPSKSYSWREFVAPYGGDQELLVALRDRGGAVWGVVGLYREPNRPLFNKDEIDFMRRIASHLAAGAHRGLLIGEASEPDGPEAPGLVILRDDWTVASLTPGVERWLEELPHGRWQRDNSLPPSVLAAGRALRSAEDENSPGAYQRWPLGRPAWGFDGRVGCPAGSGYHRAGPSGKDLPTPDVGVPADGTGAGGHPAGASRGFNGRDRRGTLCLPAHRSTASQDHLREDRGPEPQGPRRQGLLYAL